MVGVLRFAKVQAVNIGLPYTLRGQRRQVFISRSTASSDVLPMKASSSITTRADSRVPNLNGLAPLRVPRWKRCLDVTAILLTAPFWVMAMAGITLLIKTLSRSPVLFKQERFGLGGERFVCLKFRTMHQGAPTAAHEIHLQELMHPTGRCKNWTEQIPA